MRVIGEEDRGEGCKCRVRPCQTESAGGGGGDSC